MNPYNADPSIFRNPSPSRNLRLGGLGQVAIFKKEESKIEANPSVANERARKRSFPAGLWTKCPSCQNVMFTKTLRENFSVCSKCSFHFVIGAWERIELLLDPKSFVEIEAGLETLDPLQFKGLRPYLEKLKQDQKKNRASRSVRGRRGRNDGAAGSPRGDRLKIHYGIDGFGGGREDYPRCGICNQE